MQGSYVIPFDMRPKYRYKRLDSSRNEIRLLTILPGKESDTLRCSLKHFSLSSSLSYRALSYAWHDPTIYSSEALSSTEGVTIHHCKLKVGKNVAAYLRSARLTDEPTDLLWIDAICINQDDVEERSKQVLRMQDIYRFAKQVTVWLGPSADGSDLAMAFVKMVDGHCRKGDSSLFHDHSRFWPPKWSADDVAWIESGINTETFIEEWRSLAKLLQRAWWYRTWVLQEVVAAKDVAVICGKHLVDWSSFRFTVMNIVRNQSLLRDMLSPRGIYLGEKELSGVWGLLYLRGINRSLNLLNVLESTHYSSSTDPRDKVYGVLGLASDARDVVPSPDYSVDVTGVYKRLSASLLEVTGSLDFLSLSGDRIKDDSILPTWCLDLTREILVASINLTMLKPFDMPDFRASMSTSPIAAFRNELDILTLTGFCIDVISGLGSKSPTFITPIEQSRYQVSAYGTDENTYLALWNTLVAHMNWSNTVNWSFAPKVFGDLFSDQCFVAETNFQQHFGGRECGLVDFKSYTKSLALEFDRWYINNREFNIGNRPLKSWAELFTAKSANSTKNLDARQHRMWSSFENSIDRVLAYRRLMTTEKGYIGMVPASSRPGDKVCILLGGNMPFILRSKNGYHEFIGDSYVHGLMFGEAMKDLESGALQLEKFELH